jgi:HK97 family phage portal protein
MRWNIFSKADPEKKASAAGHLMVQLGQRQPRFTPRQFDQLAREGYERNVIAYRCIRLIAQNAAAVPFAIYRGREAKRVRLADHPLMNLLRRPNPLQAGTEMFEALYGYYLIAGNSYIEATGDRDRAPLELWPLRPDRMRVIPGAHGIPDAYRYQLGSQYIDYPADPLTGVASVLHLKTFHPLDDWYGMSPLEAAAYSIDQHNDAAKWNASLLQSSGRPSGALIYKPTHPDGSAGLTDEQRSALKAELESYFSGAENAGRPLVLEGGLDWREMSLSPKDMDWIAGKDISAREIALAFHVPPQLIGVEGSLTFANFEQARLALFDDAVLPLVAHVRDELNNWLAPRFGADIHIDYDTDGVEALSPRREKVWQRVTAADFMTVNEKRQTLGLPPIAGGDTLGCTP